jgi:hypothetical protein
VDGELPGELERVDLEQLGDLARLAREDRRWRELGHHRLERTHAVEAALFLCGCENGRGSGGRGASALGREGKGRTTRLTMCRMFFAAPDISGLLVKMSLAKALTLVRMCRSSFSSESMSLRMALIALFHRQDSFHR